MHKTANVLNKLPPSVHGKAKGDLHASYEAESRQDADKAFDRFLTKYGAKYAKAVACLTKDREAPLAFYDFPAEHWKHVRTTNPVESTFATVRPRTDQTKGCPCHAGPRWRWPSSSPSRPSGTGAASTDRSASLTSSAASGSATASRFKPPRTRPPPDPIHQH